MTIDKKTLRKLFLFAAGCIAFAWLLLDTQRVSAMLSSVWSLISPFATGALIAFIFNVPMHAIEKQLEDIRSQGLRRGLSILLTIGALVLVIAFVVELLIPQIQLTIASLQEKIPAFVEKTSQQLVRFMTENPQLQTWVQSIFHLESINWSTLLQEGLTVVKNSVSTLMGSAVSVIGSVTGAIVNLVISIVFAIYCLCGKETLACQGRRLLYSLVSENRADSIVRIVRLSIRTFSSFISGQCLEACILGCLFAVVMAVMKMPYIPLVSVIIGVTALIPVVGAFIGCGVGAFFILVNDPVQALTFVIMFLVLQQLENNLIYPRVVGTSIGLPGMWVLVAVTVGGELLGVAGMLFMIPMASVLYTLGKEFTHRRLQERNIPEEKLQPPRKLEEVEPAKEKKSFPLAAWIRKKLKK